MQYPRRLALCAIGLLWLACAPARGGEIGWGNELAQGLDDENAAGKAHWLDASGDRFLAIYLRARGKQTLGGVLLLGDRETHPDWPGVVATLRRRLADHGWHTLSMAPPDLGGLALAPDRRDALLAGRIGQGLAQFPAAGVTRVYLLGHGWGASACARFLATHPKTRVAGLVMVNAADPEGRLPALIEGLALPVLDLVGERDRWTAQGDPGRRAASALRAGLTDYRQIRIPGAGHDFGDLEAVLVKRVRGWLARSAERTTTP